MLLIFDHYFVLLNCCLLITKIKYHDACKLVIHGADMFYCLAPSSPWLNLVLISIFARSVVNLL